MKIETKTWNNGIDWTYEVTVDGAVVASGDRATEDQAKAAAKTEHDFRRMCSSA